MQNKKVIKDFVSLIEDIFNLGNIRFDYFIEEARKFGDGFNEESRIIYGHMDELQNGDFTNSEYKIAYFEFFNDRINKRFTEAYTSFSEPNKIDNIEQFDDWNNYITRLQFINSSIITINENKITDIESTNILLNLLDRLEFIIMFLKERIKLSDFYKDKPQIMLPKSKKEEKISVKISAEEFACLIRLMKEESILIVNKGEGKKLARVIIESFSFPDKEDRNVDYFYNQYYECLNPKDIKWNVIKEVKIKLQNLISRKNYKTT